MGNRFGRIARSAACAAVLLSGWDGAVAGGGETDGGRAIFRESVRAILADACIGCHSAEARKGGLDLSRPGPARAGGESGPAIVPGRPEESLVYEKVAGGEMPPKKGLSPEQVAEIRAWIAAGAEYDGGPLLARRAGADWWSLRPIRRPSVPEVKAEHEGWVRSPVDAFILARLEAAELTPAPEADRLAFIRRATFDLTGLPPRLEEVDAFVNDARPDAFERLVDRLLASPAYGERWARHWLDVARFAESHGYETNTLRPDAWPYRDYVIRAFNDDIPFPRFVAEQLAGDALPEGDWLSRSATGFLVGGAHDVVANRTVEGMLQQRADDLDDMVGAVSTSFLGLTVACARCHDHKFDPVTQRDYYGMQGLLAGVQHASREVPTADAERRRAEAAFVVADLARVDRAIDESEPIARPDLGAVGRSAVDPRRNVERFAPVVALAVRLTVQSTNNGIEPCVDEMEVWTAGASPKNVATGARPSASSTYPNSDLHRLEHVNDGRVGNGRSWISAVPGKGWVRLDFVGPETIDRFVWGRDREGKFADRTPAEYYVEALDSTGAWRVVASSADRADISNGARPPEPSEDRRKLLAERKALEARLAGLKPTTAVYAGTFESPGPTHLLRRGDPTQKGDVVAPAGVRAVAPTLSLAADAPESARRLALARWIGDPSNPLPTRVWVNRAWHHHFGRGIVGTPGDFGFNGEAPSHSELLDWLASEFLAGGGRLKPIHRLILLSSTYRQSSRLDPSAAEVDRDGHLLWRFPPRRLEAEEIRDAILAVSGRLDQRMGGPSYSIWEPNTNYVAVFTPKADLGPDTFRRMVYGFKARSQQDATFGAFDCPDGGLAAPRRSSSTTPLQALNLLNSRFVAARARDLADRLAREAGPESEVQARLAFRLALGREPSSDEQAGAVALIRNHGGASLARALFNAVEFVSVP